MLFCSMHSVMWVIHTQVQVKVKCFFWHMLWKPTLKCIHSDIMEIIIREYLLIVLMAKTWTFSSWGPVEHKGIRNVSSHWHCRKIHFVFVRWRTISKALPDVCFWCSKPKYIQGAASFYDVRIWICHWKLWISVKGERNQEFQSHFNAFVKIWC